MTEALAEAQAEAQLIAKEEAELEVEDKAEEQGEQKFIEIVTNKEKEYIQEDSDIDQGLSVIRSKQVEIAQKLMTNSTSNEKVDEYGIIHTSLEPIDSLVQMKGDEKKEDKKDDNASNATQVNPKLLRKAVVTNVWKMGAEAYGHAEDPLPDCPPPDEEEEKKKEKEQKKKDKEIEELKKAGKWEEPETPLIKPKPKCKPPKNDTAPADGAAAKPEEKKDAAPAALTQVKNVSANATFKATDKNV
jgi:hypothetical protein